jgi:hypothetical protein
MEVPVIGSTGKAAMSNEHVQRAELVPVLLAPWRGKGNGSNFSGRVVGDVQLWTEGVCWLATREGQTGEVFGLGRGNFVQGNKISAGVWEIGEACGA